MKLKWRVSPVPTGRYRSFEKRGWPSAEYHGTDCAAVLIRCEDEYQPRAVRDGNHGPLTLYVAHWNDPAERGDGAAFNWRKVKVQIATLGEAKALAFKVLTTHPELWPEGVK